MARPLNRVGLLRMTGRHEPRGTPFYGHCDGYRGVPSVAILLGSLRRPGG